MTLSPADRQRYARHLSLPQVGEAGQERLADSSVLLIGLGGLGSPAALYLAAAGVGRLGLLDHDTVAAHNLQRQVLHATSDIGRAKTDSARDRLEALNPGVALELWQLELTRDNARGIIADYDVVLDGTDQFSTRYLINDACVLERRPLVQASVHRFEGQLSVYHHGDGPCYRCIHPEPPPPGSVPSCAEGGVLGVVPGLFGALQATEALKLLLGVGETLGGRLLVIDTLAMRMREIAIARDPACPWCGTRSARELLADYAAFCGESAAQPPALPEALPDAAAREITPRELAPLLSAGTVVLLDVREDWELRTAALAGARHVPMGLIPSQHALLPRDRTLAVLCHHGTRSAMVADYLRSAGFPRVLNVSGGIDRWSVEVDPQVPRY